jgi:hypothetical protein
MKRVFALIIITCVLIITASLFAEEINTNDRHAFGIHFGNVSGNGYAYRYMTEKYGIQVVAGGFTSGSNSHSFADRIYRYDSNNDINLTLTDEGRKYSINLGGNLIVPLKKTENSLFYIHGGICWFYSDRKTYNRDYNIDNVYPGYYDAVGETYTTHKIRSYMNIGAGPGVELLVGKYFKLALELPVTYTGNDEFIMYIPQAGLYYYFR